MLDEAVFVPEGADVVVEVLGQTSTEDRHPDIQRYTGILPAEMNASESYYQQLLEKHR
jgi:hypothetical protein